KRVLAANKSITFVGSGTSGPTTVGGVTFPRENEGHSGYTIDDGGGRNGLQPLVQAAIANHKPHVVTLMIGTNDLNIRLDVPNAPVRLAKLIDTILDADPKLLLVVAQIIPTTFDDENALGVTYNAAIVGLVSDRANKGKHIAVVDMASAFKANANFKT